MSTLLKIKKKIKKAEHFELQVTLSDDLLDKVRSSF